MEIGTRSRFIVQSGLVLASLVCASAAHAACTAPAGVAGEMRYISPVFRFCDGGAWQSTTVTTTGTGCSTAGQITYSSNVMYFCNGSVLVNMTGATNGTCTAGQTGTISYDSTNVRPQYCNGTNWIVMQSGTAQIAVAQKIAYSGTGTGTTTNLAVFSGAVTTGSVIVCSFQSNSTTSLSSVADTKGNTYTRILTPQAPTSGWTMEMWYAENVTGGSSFKVTGTYPTSVTANVGQHCAELTGVVSSGTLDQAAYLGGTTGTATGPTLTTTSNKEMLYVSTVEAGTCALAAGWTDQSSTYANLIESKIVTTKGANATTTGSGCGGWWGLFAVSFRSQ